MKKVSFFSFLLVVLQIPLFSANQNHNDLESKKGEFFCYQARYYDPQLGRFISPDSIVPDHDPQSLNRYAYTHNDPVNHTDESGHSDDPVKMTPSWLAKLKHVVVGSQVDNAVDLFHMMVTEPAKEIGTSAMVLGYGLSGKRLPSPVGAVEVSGEMMKDAAMGGAWQLVEIGVTKGMGKVNSSVLKNLVRGGHDKMARAWSWLMGSNAEAVIHASFTPEQADMIDMVARSVARSRGLGPNDVEDFSQEVAMEVHQVLTQTAAPPGGHSVKGLANSIAQHRASDFKRNRQVIGRGEGEVPLSDTLEDELFQDVADAPDLTKLMSFLGEAAERGGAKGEIAGLLKEGMTRQEILENLSGSARGQITSNPERFVSNTLYELRREAKALGLDNER